MGEFGLLVDLIAWISNYELFFCPTSVEESCPAKTGLKQCSLLLMGWGWDGVRSQGTIDWDLGVDKLDAQICLDKI